MRNKQLPADSTDLNLWLVATFNCIFHQLIADRRKNGLSIIGTLSLRPDGLCSRALGWEPGDNGVFFWAEWLWENLPLLFRHFSFFSYNEERDWWRQQQKKNNYRQWESTTTQSWIMPSSRVNHFRKGSEDKPFYFNSSLGWYFFPLKQEGNCNTWHSLTCWAIAECSHTARAQKLKNCSFNLPGFGAESCDYYFFSLAWP